MYLTRHETMTGERWALDGRWLPVDVTLERVLCTPKAELADWLLVKLPRGEPATGGLRLLPPVEERYEVWAAGVTYLRSRDAREAESQVKDVYARVYEAERPELFFKAVGWRVAGHGMPIRVRADSKWNVPEPELTLVINAPARSSATRSATTCRRATSRATTRSTCRRRRVYNGSCAVGPGIHVGNTDRLRDLTIALEITRAGRIAFTGETRTSQIKRSLDELADFLFMELDFRRARSCRRERASSRGRTSR
jgi:2-dehydro-3-deoxy-D-arabinonate dehydratase